MLPACALAPYSHFHFAYEFFTRKLAYVLDSLVRVSGYSQITTENCSVFLPLGLLLSTFR